MTGTKTPHLLAIDQGTTGSTVLVVGADARVLGRKTTDFAQHFPRPGWVEHEPDEIWKSVVDSLVGAYAAAGVDPRECVGIGITNQRETTVVWERASGKPVHRAIVWQDRRTAERCRALADAGHGALFRARTGLVLDPYFSGTKVEWILDQVPGARARAEAGELAFGTIDSFLANRLSGGAAHVTDTSNASRTLLFDLGKLAWDRELAELLRVPTAVLPEVRGSSEVVARTKGVPGLPDGIPIAGIAGDQQSALFGQTCFAPGDAKCTYGTGAFLLLNTGETPVPSQNGLVTTVAWTRAGKTVYALEGSSFIAGAAVQWLRDGLGIIRRSADVEELARKVDSSDGVVFVPALAGLGAPHWDPDARGLLCGMTRGTTAAHVARATLEGIALSVADLGRAMEADVAGSGPLSGPDAIASTGPARHSGRHGGRMTRLRVDGGASENALLMQYQADVLDVGIDRPANVETTALGAAYLAGLAVGVFADLDAVRKAHRIARSFEPTMSAEERHKHLSRWKNAVARTRGAVA